MVYRNFIAHGDGTAMELTFQVESFFKPSQTQEDREMRENEPKPLVLIGQVIGGEVKIGDKITVKFGEQSITDTVCQIQENRTNITSAIAGKHVGIALTTTSLKKLLNLTKPTKTVA